MIKPIITNVKNLSMVCADLPDDKIEEVITDLMDTAKANIEKLVGLAANQVGHNYRAFVYKYPSGKLIPIVNPEIVFMGCGKSHALESCLSRPTKKPIWGARWRKVRLKSDSLKGKIDSWDELWEPKTSDDIRNFRNYYARIVQHEIDHLNGVLV